MLRELCVAYRLLEDYGTLKVRPCTRAYIWLKCVHVFATSCDMVYPNRHP